MTVALNDGQLDGPGTFPGGSSVTVATAGGSFTWRESTVYTYPKYQAPGVLLASGVPANATRVWTDWVDGETSLLGKGPATLAHWYPNGSWTPKITLQNAQGKASAGNAATLTVAEDTTAPWVTVDVPAAPNRAGSWSTISGRAGDGESGPDVVGVELWRFNGTTEYYYDFAARRWVKDTGGELPYSAQGLAGVDSGGSWRMPSSGLVKGYTFEVWYSAWDKVGNSTEPAHTSYYLSS